MIDEKVAAVIGERDLAWRQIVMLRRHLAWLDAQVADLTMRIETERQTGDPTIARLRRSLDDALNLLQDARPVYIDPLLRRRWAQRRRALERRER